MHVLYFFYRLLQTSAEGAQFETNSKHNQRKQALSAWIFSSRHVRVFLH